MERVQSWSPMSRLLLSLAATLPAFFVIERISHYAEGIASVRQLWATLPIRIIISTLRFDMSNNDENKPRLERGPRIFVSGGRGCLASQIAARFRMDGYQLTLFSRRSDERYRSLPELTSWEVLQSADVVLHLAWSTLPATSEQKAGSEWQDDLPNLEKILSAIASLSMERRPHFIFFSSGGSVYGNAPECPNTENDICHPIGSYGKAKLAAEKMIEAFAARFDLSFTILRVSNPYGYPVPRERMQGIIPHALRCAFNDQTLTLWGDGHARKDFLYYSDFLDVLERVIALRIPGIFNVCSGVSYSVREIVAFVEQHTKKKIALAYSEARLWDVEDSRLANRKLITATGWLPKISIEEGIMRATHHYLRSENATS